MNDDSFNAVYTAFYRRSFVFVKSYVHDEVVAEDIVTESLVKLWKLLKQNPDIQIAPLLFTILKNSALDHVKHEKTSFLAHANISRLLQRELEIRISALNASDPEEIFSSEIARIIHHALGTLHEKTRQIFEMSRFEGKPYKEIAEMYGITVKGVDYHITQALNVLRTSLKDYLPAFILWYILW
jgi:RNA polymerase sigma-70 factor, ECF subfamily